MHEGIVRVLSQLCQCVWNAVSRKIYGTSCSLNTIKIFWCFHIVHNQLDQSGSLPAGHTKFYYVLLYVRSIQKFGTEWVRSIPKSFLYELLNILTLFHRFLKPFGSRKDVLLYATDLWGTRFVAASWGVPFVVQVEYMEFSGDTLQTSSGVVGPLSACANGSGKWRTRLLDNFKRT